MFFRFYLDSIAGKALRFDCESNESGINKVSFSPSQTLGPTRPTRGGGRRTVAAVEGSGGRVEKVLALENDSDRMHFELDSVKASLLSFRHLFELENSQH